METSTLLTTTVEGRGFSLLTFHFSLFLSPIEIGHHRVVINFASGPDLCAGRHPGQRSVDEEIVDAATPRGVEIALGAQVDQSCMGQAAHTCRVGTVVEITEHEDAAADGGAHQCPQRGEARVAIPGADGGAGD